MIKSKSLIPKINKSSWITLNVGGQQFLTTKHTLLRSPSIFRQFLQDEPTEKIPSYKLKYWTQKYKAYKSPQKLNLDIQAYYQIRQKEYNTFYVDRDPICFGVVLNFLRHGKLIYTKDVSITGIMEEASYFQVEELIDIIEEISGIKRADLPRATPLYLPSRTTKEEQEIIKQNAAERLEELKQQQEEFLDQLKVLEEEKRALEGEVMQKEGPNDPDLDNKNENNNEENNNSDEIVNEEKNEENKKMTKE